MRVHVANIRVEDKKFSELAAKEKLNVGEFIDSHRKRIGGVGKKNVASIFVFGHILVFPSLKVVELDLVGALNPAGLMQLYRFVTTRRAVLVFEAILNHIELKRPHGADNFASVAGVCEELCYPFVGELD